MQKKRFRLPIVLALLTLLFAAVGGGSSDATASGLTPGLASVLSGDPPPPVAGEPDQPQTNKRLRPSNEWDGVGGPILGNGLRRFTGMGRIWTTIYFSRWFSR